MLPTSISPRAADDSGGKERLGDGREGGRERARRRELGRARARRGRSNLMRACHASPTPTFHIYICITIMIWRLQYIYVSLL